MKALYRKHFLSRRVLPLVVLALVVKVLLMREGFAFFELNSYFSTLVAANVFLLGFLISGVLPDYKEAEKLPGEMAASLDSIVDECRALYGDKKVAAAKDVIEHTSVVIKELNKWFHEESRTRNVMRHLSRYAELFVALEPHTQANFLTRMKQEVSSIRRMVLRTRNIRDVPFASPAYAVAELFSALVITSVILVDTGTLGESLLITGLITYVLTYMIWFIRDLDNPFHYHDNAHLTDEIAIAPLAAVERNIKDVFGKKAKAVSTK
ncbi:MAG: hypothetical protein UY72_C0035G0016 [Candidatus Uhrbacteria bacterium GW2011_GWD2_52_7]|uniref:Uncharacterized protein n=1 Tax=Candidatus Uhrbacteria bacterium GW2011_GWD2_52_7 TaxID=1618989 RepID=A0A0G1XFK3_9BACT|nr:MAG: hypothetical protein UY72_C0035G0016 [Candidatus Uhrbacteria bacterium GW2011_GWD2_52_7]